jgi:predicted transposase/invertase (TIGR01784 family)
MDEKQQSQHDPFFRSTFEDKRLFRELLIWLIPFLVDLLDLDHMEMQKDSLIDEKLKTHYTDLLYKIPVQGTDKNIVVFILLEHKAASEYWTMLQVLRYVVEIWCREYNAAIEQNRLATFMLPPVLPIIVYHGERNFTAPIRFCKLIRPIKGFEKYQLDFEAILLDLMKFDKTKPPEDLELFAVLAVMQAIFRKDAAERVKRIYQKIKHKMSDPRYSGRFVKLLRYMITSSKYFSYDNLNEVTSQMSDTDVATIAPCLGELISIGVTRGREEGRVEERTIWANDKIETLLRILTKNFGEVPLAIRDKLHSIHDINVLGQLTDFALDCNTLDEFEKFWQSKVSQ